MLVCPRFASWFPLAVTVCGVVGLTAACGLSEFPRGTGQAGPDAGSSAIDAPGPPSPADVGMARPGSPDVKTPAADVAAVDTGAPPPPASGPTVTIGGMPVARENVIVFLHIGHSNMAGRTNTPAALRPFNYETDPHLWAYAKGGVWQPAKEPLSGDYLTKMNAGPGMSILHTALGLAPSRFMVSIGRGHDGSIGGHCRNFRKGALLYDFVMGPAMELKGKVTFGGIFTMLGINEFRRDATNLEKFNECLAGIASDMRTDLGDPNIPFAMGDWEAGATGDFLPTHDYAITTKAQLRLAVANIPRSVLIPTEMLPMSDDHHFDLTGYKMWAERGFELMKAAALLPWAAQ